MTKPYFRQVPNFEYISRSTENKYISEYAPVKNLFKRGKLREDIFGNLAFFEKYQIIGDERPDNVAFKFYGDSTLDWIVLLSNNILNIQSEWPMTQRTFEEYVLDKYGSYETLNSTHHFETNEIKDRSGRTVLPSGIKLETPWKTNGNFLETISSKINDISCDSSGLVTVTMVNSILGLEVGDEVTINNVSVNDYNGKHEVIEILETLEDSENNVTKFTYELPSVPRFLNPNIANPRIEEVVFTIPENPGQRQLSSNAYYYEYWDSSLGYTVLVPSNNLLRTVTNYEYELLLEEAKRNIYVLKPEYLNVVFNDMDDIMPYKRGSQQYVSENLKRGENIRLYD